MGSRSRRVHCNLLGSGDGYVYCLNVLTGQLVWKTKTEASVLGSPVIVGDTVFIGGSDHNFRALNLKNGKEYWTFSGLQGPVVSTPLIYGNLAIKVVFFFGGVFSSPK